MNRVLVRGSVLLMVLTLAATACSKSTSSSSTPSPENSGAPVPTATTITMPVTYGYYDGHVDTMLSTDVSSKAEAQAKHLDYAPALLTRPANTFPALYIIMGTAAPKQPLVFGTEPGESDYSPIWQEINVRWKAGVKPVLLVKDDQIKALAAKGDLTVDPTPVVLNCPIVKVS